MIMRDAWPCSFFDSLLWKCGYGQIRQELFLVTAFLITNDGDEYKLKSFPYLAFIQKTPGHVGKTTLPPGTGNSLWCRWAQPAVVNPQSESVIAQESYSSNGP